MIFHWKELTFFTFEKKFKKIQLFVFRSRKNNIFSELRKKLGYSFDAEICPLSIYDVSSAIKALYPCELAKMWKSSVFPPLNVVYRHSTSWIFCTARLQKHEIGSWKKTLTLFSGTGAHLQGFASMYTMSCIYAGKIKLLLKSIKNCIYDGDFL